MTQTRFKKIPFDLELAKKITNKEAKGRIVTDDGHEVRIICYDYRHFGGKNRLVALIDLGDNEIALSYNNEGKEIDNREKFAIHLEVPTYYKDYSNFVPQKWQPCLVRESIYDHWKVRVCADNKQQVTFYDSSNCCSGDILWDFKLPLSKITERLIGTTKSYEQLIKELDKNGQD